MIGSHLPCWPACNSSSQGSHALFWLSLMHAHIHTPLHFNSWVNLLTSSVLRPVQRNADSICVKTLFMLGILVYTNNPITWEIQTEGFLNARPALNILGSPISKKKGNLKKKQTTVSAMSSRLGNNLCCQWAKSSSFQPLLIDRGCTG